MRQIRMIFKNKSIDNKKISFIIENKVENSFQLNLFQCSRIHIVSMNYCFIFVHFIIRKMKTLSILILLFAATISQSGNQRRKRKDVIQSLNETIYQKVVDKIVTGGQSIISKNGQIIVINNKTSNSDEIVKIMSIKFEQFLTIDPNGTNKIQKIAMSSDGTHISFVDSISNKLFGYRKDNNNYTIIGEIALPQRPRSIDVSNSGNLVCVVGLNLMLIIYRFADNKYQFYQSINLKTLTNSNNLKAWTQFWSCKFTKQASEVIVGSINGQFYQLSTDPLFVYKYTVNLGGSGPPKTAYDMDISQDGLTLFIGTQINHLVYKRSNLQDQFILFEQVDNSCYYAETVAMTSNAYYLYANCYDPPTTAVYRKNEKNHYVQVQLFQNKISDQISVTSDGNTLLISDIGDNMIKIYYAKDQSDLALKIALGIVIPLIVIAIIIGAYCFYRKYKVVSRNSAGQTHPIGNNSQIMDQKDLIKMNKKQESDLRECEVQTDGFQFSIEDVQ